MSAGRRDQDGWRNGKPRERDREDALSRLAGHASGDRGRGDARTREMLWILLDRDDAESPDFRQAAAWLQKAASQGDARARATSGEISEFGDGVPRDMAAAIGWYRWSARQGNIKAQILLDDCMPANKANTAATARPGSGSARRPDRQAPKRSSVCTSCAVTGLAGTGNPARQSSGRARRQSKAIAPDGASSCRCISTGRRPHVNRSGKAAETETRAVAISDRAGLAASGSWSCRTGPAIAVAQRAAPPAGRWSGVAARMRRDRRCRLALRLDAGYGRATETCNVRARWQ